MREVFVYSNGKIYKEGSKKPLKHKKLLGCHNNYQITLSNSCDVFLKQGTGASDYADVISKSLCDEVGVKCADCDLVLMKDFPQVDEKKKMNFEEYKDFCKSNFHIEDINKIEQYYNNYLAIMEKERVHNAVVSYDYKIDEPYNNAQIIKLDELVCAYCNVTGSDGTYAIETYNKIANELVSDSVIGKKLRKQLKIKKHVDLSSDFDLDLKKIALLGYATCQMDMSSHNLHLALIRNGKNYKLEVAPLFDNGESFNLASLNDENLTKEDVDAINSTSKEYGNALTLKESANMNAHQQLIDLAEEMRLNPELYEFYKKLKSVDIEHICDKEIDKQDLDVVKHAVISVYEERMFLLEQEYNRQNKEFDTLLGRKGSSYQSLKDRGKLDIDLNIKR
ncbi:MAG: hypothetical protein E7184_00295 [Erysipelotrichaceae bacterium]|nr:hypothetical protein [Erysipelotrichaceae bacterium]